MGTAIAQNEVNLETQKINCTVLPNCQCYTENQVSKIAGGIKDLTKCEFALSEKTRLIDERFIKFDGQNGVAWWQEPTVVAGGIAISFSVGFVFAFLLVDK